LRHCDSIENIKEKLRFSATLVSRAEIKACTGCLHTFFSLNYSFLEKAVNSNARSVFEMKPFSPSPLS
jgi:hypothetical protein